MKRLRNKKVLIMDDLKGSGIEQAIFYYPGRGRMERRFAG